MINRNLIFMLLFCISKMAFANECLYESLNEVEKNAVAIVVATKVSDGLSFQEYIAQKSEQNGHKKAKNWGEVIRDNRYSKFYVEKSIKGELKEGMYLEFDDRVVSLSYDLHRQYVVMFEYLDNELVVDTCIYANLANNVAHYGDKTVSLNDFLKFFGVR